MKCGILLCHKTRGKERIIYKTQAIMQASLRHSLAAAYLLYPETPPGTVAKEKGLQLRCHPSVG
jgi:hypothetical protein